MDGFYNKKAQCDWLSKRWANEVDLEKLKLWAREQRYSFYYSMPTNDILHLIQKIKNRKISPIKSLKKHEKDLHTGESLIPWESDHY